MSLKSCRVLAVDDSRATRNFLSTLLEPVCAGFESADSGRAGLAKLRKGQFDLILLDMQLPDIDGIDVLEEIRRSNEDCAIVILTGEGGTRTATDAVGHGADGYIEKQHMSLSKDQDEFFYALSRALDHRAGLRARRELEIVKGEFYAMVTHDLRNPAATVERIVGLLLDEGVGPLNEKQRHLLSLGRDSVEEMLRLIRDYLDYSRIQSSPLILHRQNIDLCDFAASLEGSARIEAEHRSHELIIDLPREAVYAQVDPSWLRQSLSNLLTNAVKYTDPGGRIVLRLRREGDDALFCVEDNGPGIPAEVIPRLFAPYRSVPHGAMDTGTGLGLVVVKQVLEAHGGHVWAESSGVAGEGARFFLRLPAVAGTGIGTVRP